MGMKPGTNLSSRPLEGAAERTAYPLLTVREAGVEAVFLAAFGSQQEGMPVSVPEPSLTHRCSRRPTAYASASEHGSAPALNETSRRPVPRLLSSYRRGGAGVEAAAGDGAGGLPRATQRGGQEVAYQDLAGQTPGRQIPAAVELAAMLLSSARTASRQVGVVGG